MKKIRKNFKLLTLNSITILFAVSALFAQKTYYVDATSGNDSNNGTSTSTAWKTINKLNTSSFVPGDVIRFKSGETFPGSLVISSSGSSRNPIIYDRYGNGALPILDGKGGDYTVYAKNKEYLEFKNLKFTNFRPGTITPTDIFSAMIFESEDYGTVNHLHFDNITVFKVNSSTDKSEADTRYHGGILFYARGSAVKSNFNDIIVENSTFEDIGRTGVNIRSDWWKRNSNSTFGQDLGDGTLDTWYPTTNMIFRDNIFQRIRGNGLIVRVSVDAMVEGNLFDTCGDGISGNAAFNFNTDGTVFQFNEAKNTVFNQGDSDARGIDSDFRTKNTIIQYNYLHDNGLGGVVATGGPQTPGFIPERFNIGTVVRYNIVENNARQGMHFSGAIDGLEVYNNVFYADNTHNNLTILNFKKWSAAWPKNINVRNNIFYFTGDNLSYNFRDGNGGGSSGISFSNNLYFGTYASKLPISGNSETLTGVTKDNNYSLNDPLFVNSSNGGLTYAVREGSPVLGKGVNFSQPTLDYYGSTINKSSVNIGIFQGDGIPDNKTKTETIYITEDAFTRGGSNANTNYGSSSVVETKQATANFVREGFLKYNFNSINGSIKKAVLRVYASSNTNNSYQNYFFGIDNDNWSESTITENNKPATGISPAFSAVTINSSNGKWYEVDITSFIQQQYDVDKIASLVIKDSDDSQFLTSITSKEGNASQKSHIIIEYYGESSSREIAIEDSYTRGGSFADDNYGKEAEINTKKSSANFNRVSMLKFDISDHQNSITCARLHFYASTNTVNQFNHYIRKYSNDWDEDTITENNRPEVGDIISSVALEGTESKWYSVDVTAYVQEQKNRNSPNVSFAIDDQDVTTFLSKIISKDGSEVFPPFLEIDSTSILSDGDELEDFSAFKIYPNPIIHSDFTLQKTFKSNDKLVMKIVDITGKMVNTSIENVEQGLWKKTFYKEKLGLSRGIYVINISSDLHGTSSSKVLVY